MKSLMKILFFIFYQSIILTLGDNKVYTDFDVLTDVFFSNLQENPYIKDKELNFSTKQFIDKQVENYIALIKNTYGLFEHSLTRRSLQSDGISSIKAYNSDFHLLDGFVARFNIKVNSPKDIVFFRNGFDENGKLFAAALECNTIGGAAADDLIIYELNNDEFMEIQRVAVKDGVKIGTYSGVESTFLAVAKYNAPPNNFYEETGIYEFTPKRKLERIQSLNHHYTNDVIFWNNSQHVFVVFLQHMINNSANIEYEVVTPIYKWMGKHFDIIDHIRTYGAKSATFFSVGNSDFLAVANFRNTFGYTNIYSEIFKYNLHTEKFESYQKILTNAAVDVKYFQFKFNDMEEYFLVFANLYETDINGTLNYETDSIIYKFVDNYFIPFQSFHLNGVTQWLHFPGPNGECILLAACKFEGVKIFHYNGWRFIESQIQYTKDAFSKGIISMHAYQLNQTTILALANENDHGNMINVLEPVFVDQNEPVQFYTEMFEWCKDSTQSLQSVSIEELNKRVEESPKSEDLVLELEESISFDNLIVQNLRTLEQNDTSEAESDERLYKLKDDLRTYAKKLKDLEVQAESSLQANSTNIIKGDVYVDKLILKNETTIKSATIDKINGMNISDILKNVININEGFTSETKMKFHNITIDNKFTPKFINGHPADDVFSKNISNLTIDGDVKCKTGLTLNGSLNGIDFSSNDILLKAEKIKNKSSIKKREAILKDRPPELPTDIITNLTVRHLIVADYVNDIDISTLHKYALRKVGDQVIQANYTFDRLIVNNLDTKVISGKKIPEDLIVIDKGNFEIEHNIRFSNEFRAKDLIVMERLNDIPVINEQLDVLLTDTEQKQHVTGFKQFENIELLHPLRLHTKFHSRKVNKMNPVVIIDDEIVLHGDYVIDGNVSIDASFQATNLKTANSELSVNKLFDKGIETWATQIPVHLQFWQQLHMQKLFVDKINDINANSFLISGLEEPQVITGKKIFVGDLTITGSVNLTNVNGINVKELDDNILKIYGNQSIVGRHHFENIIANRVYNVKTQCGKQEWDEVITIYGEQEITGTTVIANSMHAKHLTTKVLNFNSHINQYDFNAMINDTVFHGGDHVITGRKKFINITAENVYAENLDLNQLEATIENAKATFQLDENIDLPENILVENIIFNNYFNEIPADHFGHAWLITEDEQVIESGQHFDEMIIHGNLIIKSGLINGISITNIKENTAKIDEPFHFGTVTFANGLASLHPITLEGNFEALPLNDIVQSYVEIPQTLFDQITFKENVTVFGKIIFNGLISGINLTQFCELSKQLENGTPRNLYIQGNAYFAKGPEIYYINNSPIQHIYDNAWFKNYETQITGHMEFDQIVFKENAAVHGSVDDVDLASVEQTYFSKTQDQHITFLLDFDGGVMFSEDMYAKEAIVSGEIGGVNLDEFVRTVILNNYEQVFENTIYLENCVIQNLQGEYRVNGFDLESDFMRYDKENVVTGKKIIRDVQTHALQLDKNIKVQNVDILQMLHGSVLKIGTFKIPGKIIFYNYTTFVNGISSQYLVNNLKFNDKTIMLRSLPQTITGKKAIFPNFNYITNIESLKLKGQLNGIDITELLYNQAFKNEKTNFMGPMNFTAEISASNVKIEKLYQGINVSQLINNITQLESFENYEENYNRLLNVSSKVKDSLAAQAYYLDYYKMVQIYKNIHQLIPFTMDNSTDQYLAAIIKSNQNYSIHFHKWDEEGERFKTHKAMGNITIPLKVHYLKKIMFRGKERWYLENEELQNNKTSNTPKKFQTVIYTLLRNGLSQSTVSLFHNGTRFVASVILPDDNRNCILMVFFSVSTLYCEVQGQNKTGPFQEVQTFKSEGAVEANSITVEGVPYIFIAYSGTLFDESNVDIWKYNTKTKQFQLEQIIYVNQPRSITTILYQNTYYLAIASGAMLNEKNSGLITILRYNGRSSEFMNWQDIPITAPEQIEFAQLPSDELLLYLLTSDKEKPLTVFMYEGISGFKKKTTVSPALETKNILELTTTKNRHFILTCSANECRIIQAVFGGTKHDF